jgi:DNA-binding protein HU-beta
MGVSLNKSDLVTSVAGTTGLAKKDAARAVDGVLAAITCALKEGHEVRLTGFGTFSVAERAASKGRDPRTGECIDISASRQAKFRASKSLKGELL